VNRQMQYTEGLCRVAASSWTQDLYSGLFFCCKNVKLIYQQTENHSRIRFMTGEVTVFISID